MRNFDCGLQKRKRIFFILLLMLVVSFTVVIARYPEVPARLLTAQEDWDVPNEKKHAVPFSVFPKQYNQVRKSVLKSTGGVLFRTWVPGSGNKPLNLISAPFKPARYMSVAITGNTRNPRGHIVAVIECEPNGQRLEVFKGDVNVNVTESIVVTPPGWCPGNARLKFSSTKKGIYAGIGSVYEISFLSYLKSTFLGTLPYLIVSFAIYAMTMFAGASLAIRLSGHDEALPFAFGSLGAAALSIFYIDNILPIEWRWAGGAFIAVGSITAILIAGGDARKKSINGLIPYAHVWGIASLTYFSILGLAVNGLGHWEPNYRFWPATWSSDNELPWLFAEAVRNGWGLKGLFGGQWQPTDRPPLMTGAHLLVADVFGWLQAGNDGAYLRGKTYNASAVVLNALWAPACWWLLATFNRQLDQRGRIAILLLVGCLPFVLFNTVYGWPKAFGAALALVAFGMAWQSRTIQSKPLRQWSIVLFFALGALSMLAHASTALFLAPLGLLFLCWTLRSNFSSVLLGFAIAFALLASWKTYQMVVLPSSMPITKLALTGDYGFSHPDRSLWQMLATRYGALNFWDWLEIKKVMSLHAAMPIDHKIVPYRLITNYGAGFIDRLRAWDFMLLSKGNVALIFFVLIASWSAISAFSARRPDEIRQDAPYLVLIGVSLMAWLLIVLAFFVPVIIPVWPQAALFGLAIAGAAITYSRFPLVFRFMLIIMMVYTGVVWIISPLHSALDIDKGAALVLVFLGSWAFSSKLMADEH